MDLFYVFWPWRVRERKKKLCLVNISQANKANKRRRTYSIHKLVDKTTSYLIVFEEREKKKINSTAATTTTTTPSSNFQAHKLLIFDSTQIHQVLCIQPVAQHFGNAHFGLGFIFLYFNRSIAFTRYTHKNWNLFTKWKSKPSAEKKSRCFELDEMVWNARIGVAKTIFDKNGWYKPEKKK